MGATRRNLIVVLTHGLRDDALSDRRAWPLLTPNLDKLGERGARLTAMAASTADPMAIDAALSGLHVRQQGGGVGRDVGSAASWVAAARAEGLYTAGVGLVGSFAEELEAAVQVQPVDSAAHRECAYLKSTRRQGLTAALLHQRKQRHRGGIFEPERLLVDPAEDVDGWILQQADQQLRPMPTNRAWLLLVVLTGPANDLPAPSIYAEATPLAELRLGYTPANFPALSDRVELDYPRSVLQRMTPDRLARIRADYLGRVSLIDYGIGRMVDAVDDRSDRGRTWMMVAGDRGHLLGELGVVGHRSVLPAAWRTPLLVTPPAHLPPVEASRRLHSTADAARTAAEILQLDSLKALAGRSVLDLWRGDVRHDAGHRQVMMEIGDALCVQTREWLAVFRDGQLTGVFQSQDELLERNLLLDGLSMSDALAKVAPSALQALLPLSRCANSTPA